MEWLGTQGRTGGLSSIHFLGELEKVTLSLS